MILNDLSGPVFAVSSSSKELNKQLLTAPEVL